MKAIAIVFLLIMCVVYSGFLFLLYRTITTHDSPSQKLFSQGTLPNPSLEGFYQGQFEGFALPWEGKIFYASRANGVNVIDNSSRNKQAYPFRTYVGRGLYDKDLEVLKLDYDLPTNPFWLRRLLDEVVEIEPGKYLGKVQLRITDQYAFALGFFHLEQASEAASGF